MRPPMNLNEHKYITNEFAFISVHLRTAFIQTYYGVVR